LAKLLARPPHASLVPGSNLGPLLLGDSLGAQKISYEYKRRGPPVQYNIIFAVWSHYIKYIKNQMNLLKGRIKADRKTF
jgi:hypothetical protein